MRLSNTTSSIHVITFKALALDILDVEVRVDLNGVSGEASTREEAVNV